MIEGGGEDSWIFVRISSRFKDSLGFLGDSYPVAQAISWQLGELKGRTRSFLPLRPFPPCHFDGGRRGKKGEEPQRCLGWILLKKSIHRLDAEID